MNKTANIALWGPNVSEISTLVHTLKTGKYVQPQQSIHPFSEEITIGNVTVTAAGPSANEGARLGWRSSLSDHDGIVYLVDAERLSQSKEELAGILSDDKVTKPVLVLGPKSDPSGEVGLREQLDLADATKGGRAFALFTYSLSEAQSEGTEEAFQWLLERI